MTSVSSSTSASSSNRITGLATGMDIDEMVKGMLTADKSKIDKAEQKKQTEVWQQDTYRGVITDVKGLYDKYFTATSDDYILGSKTFSVINVKSSNSNVITATAGAGADNINYKFKVNKLAEPAKLQGTVARNKVISTQEEKININGKEITIAANSTVDDVIKNINNTFSDDSVKASYSEMTGKVTIETKETGEDSKLEFSGALFDKMGIPTKDNLGQPITEVKGSNSNIEVYDADGTTLLRKIEEKKNSFTIDSITYNVNDTSTELVSMKSTKDTQNTVDKIKEFITDYNKMTEKIYGLVTEKKDYNYQPLTDDQKDEMSDKEIEDWEKKAKAGILRNDNDLRRFLDNMRNAILGQAGLSDIGITGVDGYSKPGQLALDEEKLKSALEEDNYSVYKTVTDALDKMRDVTYSYAGSSSSVFAKKAGIANTASETNNLFTEQIKKQEEYIKDLKNKMQEKQEKLYQKFADLESSMNTLNSQMSYLISSLS